MLAATTVKLMSCLIAEDLSLVRFEFEMLAFLGVAENVPQICKILSQMLRSYTLQLLLH